VIVLDTNIYISALNFHRGKPHQLLQMAIAGHIEVAISDAILQEVQGVLRKKFHAMEEDVREADALISACTTRVTPTQTVAVVTEDPDDDRILECAVAAGADAIVTGDDDLLRRGEYQGIRIMTVAQFLERGRATQEL
jgi:putative PIN family toxin of toxin-antitoxin system